MSTLVPTRTTTVTVPCPGWKDDTTECTAPLEVEYTLSGRHRRATYWTPSETPEVTLDAIPMRCAVCGTTFDAHDTLMICEAAERKIGEEMFRG